MNVCNPISFQALKAKTIFLIHHVCYRLNYVPSKFICWVSTPSTYNVTVFGNKAFEEMQAKMRSLGWALIQSDWCPYKKRKFEQSWEYVHTEEITWRYKREAAMCKLKRKALEETKPADFFFGLPTFKNSNKIDFCCLSHCLWYFLVALAHQYGV